MKAYFASLSLALVSIFVSPAQAADEITGPCEWNSVNTNGIAEWQREVAARAGMKVWKGVVADAAKREVRLLVEAAGHPAGVTTEFAVVGPLSDRAYEALFVSVALPGDIVRAVESLGVKRGRCMGARRFQFTPFGERFDWSAVKVGGDGRETPLAAFFSDAEAEAPLLAPGQAIFAGAQWEQGVCHADTNMPSSVFSLYNAPDTVFDVATPCSQSEVYGRLTTKKHLTRGELFELILRPRLPADGKPTVRECAVRLSASEAGVVGSLRYVDGEEYAALPLEALLKKLAACAAAGHESVVTLSFDGSLTVKQAAAAAGAFDLIDCKGVRMDGVAEGELFFRAFQPREKWRDREGRMPQPFEIHLSRTDAGGWKRVLTFIDEDWSGESMDPKLTPRDFPFERWEELPALVTKAAGAESKVDLFFFFAPSDARLEEILPGVKALGTRAGVVYVFGE